MFIKKSNFTTTLSVFFYYSGISNLFFFLNRKSKRILSYHNIIPDNLYTQNLIDGNSIASSVFDKQLTYISSKFKIGTDINNKQELTITFDDGYLNQHNIAHTLLKKHNLRAIFFISLDLLSEDAETLLIDRFLFWLSYVPIQKYQLHIPDPIGSIILNITDDLGRLTAWQQIYSKISNNYSKAAPLILKALNEAYPFAEIAKKIEQTYKTLRLTGMSKNAIEDLKNYGHKIGAHAKTHAPLTALSDQELEDEIKACSYEMNSLFNTTIFSYPFGGFLEVTDREANCVKKYGFTDAVTNINDPRLSIQNFDSYFIPRMSLPNTDSKAELAFHLSGAKYFLQHGKLLTID